MPQSASTPRPPPGQSAAAPPARSVSTGRWLLYRLGEGLWRVLVRTMRVMPPLWFTRVAAPVLKAAALCAVPRRRIAAVMDAAFGDTYTPASRRGLARGVRQRIAENVLDCLLQIGYPERLAGVLDVQGREHMETALAQGRGAIALGFHLGNFVLLPGAMGAAGYPVHSLLRFLDDPRLMQLVVRHSRQVFTELIPSLPRREAVRRILGVLRDNGTVLMLADSLKRGELETTLFGQPVRTARGIMSLARRTRAPVLPVYLVRGYTSRLQLVIEPEMKMERTGDPGADLAVNTGRVMRFLEDLVRRYPDQWCWLTVKLTRRSAPAGAGRRCPTPRRNDRFQ